MMDKEFLIIGQGIAGSSVALELLRRKNSFTVFDNLSQNNSSLITSGLINPVTGRRFVKSWKWSVLRTRALETYRFAEELLGKKYISEKTLNRVLQSKQQEDRWIERTALPDYEGLLSSEFYNLDAAFSQDGLYGKTKEVLHIRMDLLLPDLRKYLQKLDLYENRAISPEEIKSGNLDTNKFQYKHVIDCSGYANISDPEFLGNHVKFSTGERILIQFEQPVDIDLIKFKYFIIPQESNQYWIGSFNTWDTLDKPSDQAKNTLIEFVKNKIAVPFKVLTHNHGTRMSTQDRRPIVGRCRDNLYILNGLGTKGVSLGPYCAEQLIEHILSGKTIDPEIQIDRFI